MKNIVVLISGYGANLQSIIDYFDCNEEIKISKVISNNKQAYGVKRAEKACIDCTILDSETYPDTIDYNKLLYLTIYKENPDLIVLANYKKLLTSEFLERIECPVINIYPSLMDNFKSYSPVEDALLSMSDKTGVTIYYVTGDFEESDIIYQEEVEIKTNDSFDSLRERIRKVETQVYPEMIEKILSEMDDKS